MAHDSGGRGEYTKKPWRAGDTDAGRRPLNTPSNLSASPNDGVTQRQETETSLATTSQDCRGCPNAESCATRANEQLLGLVSNIGLSHSTPTNR